jgi:transcriptional antiterminator RfaH
MSSAKWLLLQVKSSQELRAIENLEFQGGQCYCPMITLDKIVAGKRSKVKEALFPGYVFIDMVKLFRTIQLRGFL